MGILSSFQGEFLKAFSRSDLNGEFYLTEGTALSAFYLQHRLSEDLDFFTSDPGVFHRVPRIVEGLAGQLGCRLKVERSFPSFFDGDLLLADGTSTKIDFAVDSAFRLKPPVVNAEFGIQLDNELDIACNKLSALFDRSEAKDFVDVYFIVREMRSWESLLEATRKKHVGLEPQFLAKALLRVQDLKTLPRMVKPLELPALREFFLGLARGLMNQI